MKHLQYQIPKILLYSRLLFSFVIIFLTLSNYSDATRIVLVLLYTGVITDVLDGIIARKLNISTANFRLLDTIFDLFFYLSILFFIYSIRRYEIEYNLELILAVFVLEGLMYATSLLRFGKYPSPHAILSKCWGIYLVIEFTLLLLQIEGNHFTIALIIGLVVHADRLLIYMLLKHWEHDIPSSYHALLLRQGKQISRNKLLMVE